jgi:hypothetical protein
MFPFYNLMNLNDLMGQLILAPAPGVELRPSIHGLWVSASRDLWYAGGGAFNNSLFGYTGGPQIQAITYRHYWIASSNGFLTIMRPPPSITGMPLAAA